MDSELLQSCVALINEQYLQKQGWLAVVANLENIAGYVIDCGVKERAWHKFLLCCANIQPNCVTNRNVIYMLEIIERVTWQASFIYLLILAK